MNCRILNKAVQQGLRHSHCRYLSMQQNINKCSSTCHSFNFHRRKENRSSSFIFTTLTNDKTLCPTSIPIYTNFQRNLSGTVQLNQAASVEELKKATDVAPPTEELAGDLTAKFISPEVAENFLVEYAQQVLMQVHQATGLPWWASIALTAFFIRTTMVLPFSISQVRLMAKLEKVNMDMQNVEKTLKVESVKAQTEYGWPEKLTKQKFQEAKNKAWANMIQKENCNPLQGYLLISIQIPVWLTYTAATCTLCDPHTGSLNIYNQMATEGFGWVANLTLVDPYFILPVSIAIINLCTVEVHHSFKVMRRSHSEQWKCAFFRILSLGMIPLAASLPAAVNIYWLSSSCYGLLQAFILNSSPMRKLFRVQMNDPELKYPYRFFLKNIKEKFRRSNKDSAIVTK